jgi:hypothetical protein
VGKSPGYFSDSGREEDVFFLNFLARGKVIFGLLVGKIGKLRDPKMHIWARLGV